MSGSRIALSFVLLLLVTGCGGNRKTPEPARTEFGVQTIEVRARIKDVIGGNRKAVISAGRDHGVVVGTTFALYRKGEMIGRVQVTGIWEKECGGHIVSSRKSVLPGDEAVATVAVGTPEVTRADLEKMPGLRKHRPGTIHASLIAVREKDGRVVLDAGSKRGVKLGKVFYVYRGDSYVGRVKITLVKPGMAGAEIVEKRVSLGLDCRAVYDPEDELRDSGGTGRKPKTADLDAQISGLEAKISDPKTSEADRKAARQVLLRLKKERRGK